MMELCSDEGWTKSNLNLLLGIQFRKRWDWEAGSNDHAVEFAPGQLRHHVFDGSKANVGGDAEQFENLGDIGAARTRARTDADSQSAEVVERFDREALEHRKVKCRVVHREYDAHRPVPGSTRPVGPVPAPQGEARGDEAEQGFLLFHEHDVLGPSLGHLRGDLDLRCPAQYPRASLALTVIPPPGDPVRMVMERGQFVAWARTGSLEASTEAASPATKHSAPTTVVTAWRLRAIGGPTACPIARVLYWY